MVDALAISALAVIIVFLAFRVRDRPGLNRQRVSPVEVSMDDAATTGRVTAPVSLLVLCDFASDGCAGFVRDVLPEIKRRFVASGEVRLAFRYRSSNASRDVRQSSAAVCLGRDGSFWSFYEALFSSPARSVEQRMKTLLTEQAHAKSALRACLESQRAVQNANGEDLAAATLGPGAPAYLIGTAVGNRLQVRATYVGSVPFRQLKRSLDSILAGVRLAPASHGG
jgi:protein-disulfide isomerase